MMTSETSKNYTLRLQNTETREKEALKTIKPGHVSMYTCGPTVYNYAHIGNFRTYVFEDLLRRTLKFFGYKVNQVMNLTDVDDKTIKGALEKGTSLNEFTQPYIDAFFEDLDALGIERVEQYPRATDYIAEMITFIEDLIEKGVAYKGNDGSVYFAITKFSRYGCLSNFKLDELQVGASQRVASDEYDKDNVSDFVLWKALDAERDGDIYWESPFGPGRPGWHLECSTMAIKILGETLDIHVGGVDNIFPHHENEIAQSECCTGKTFAKLWLHSEHLIVDGKKMSKSLGNFYSLRDLLGKGFTGRQVRYMLLHTHYRTQLNFTMDELNGVGSSLQRLHDFVIRMREQDGLNDGGEVEAVLEKAMDVFTTSLADDLNISAALAALFDCVREVNILCDAGKVSKGEGEQVLKFLERCDSVLNIIPLEEEEDAPAEILEALENREKARKEKNWAEADRLRDFIQDNGFIIEDTPKGPRAKRK